MTAPVVTILSLDSFPTPHVPAIVPTTKNLPALILPVKSLTPTGAGPTSPGTLLFPVASKSVETEDKSKTHVMMATSLMEMAVLQSAP